MLLGGAVAVVTSVVLLAGCGGGDEPGSGASSPALPSGEIVFTGSGLNLFVVASDGSRLRLLVRNASDAAVSSDGRQIVFMRDGEIWLMRSDGSQQRLLSNEICGTSPVWSSDNRTIYFTDCRHVIASINVDGTSLRQLTHRAVTSVGGGVESESMDEAPAPSPDGRMIVFKRVSDTAHWADISLAAIKPDGRHARVPFKLPVEGGSQEEVYAPAWDPRGRTLAYTFHDVPFDTLTGLYVASSDGSSPRRIVSGEAFAPAWSPDGEWIAFTRPALGAGLWLVRSDGTELRQVPHVTADRQYAHPAWLPPTS
jgi:Tol biopolymer transport system component